MSRPFPLLLSVAMGTMAGIGVVVVLVAGWVDPVPILAGVAIGAVASLPLTWWIARRIENA